MAKKFGNLAVLIFGHDGYEFLWDSWYKYFKKNWDFSLANIYFNNEKKDVNFEGIKQIKTDIQDVNLWTKRMREVLSQIPEEDIFFFMGDEFFIKPVPEFTNVYKAYRFLNADSMRVRPISGANKIEQIPIIKGLEIKKFCNDSQYLISYSPNIIKKSFFLDCIKVDESAWDNEVKGTERIRKDNRNIYIYNKYWTANTMVKGCLVPEYRHLITMPK